MGIVLSHYYEEKPLRDHNRLPWYANIIVAIFYSNFCHHLIPDNERFFNKNTLFSLLLWRTCYLWKIPYRLFLKALCFQQEFTYCTQFWLYRVFLSFFFQKSIWPTCKWMQYNRSWCLIMSTTCDGFMTWTSIPFPIILMCSKQNNKNNKTPIFKLSRPLTITRRHWFYWRKQK